jgi:hypothetical protein
MSMLTRACLWLIAATPLAACATPLGTAAPTVPSDKMPVVAGAAAGGAAVLWVAAGGCKLQGCVHGYVCNERTEVCDPAPCGAAGCAVGLRCDPTQGSCVPAPR